MIVSHFELIFKPQAPGPANGVNVDRVVQGYFLKITNLEPKDLKFQVQFVMAPPAPGLPERSLSGNAIYFVDTPPGTDNQSGVLNGAATASVFSLSRGFIPIPAGGTALLAVLPSIFGSAFDPTPLTTPNFEARGHVVLKLPALRRPFTFRSEPQSDKPVQVLLTPQSRSTFFSAANTITDQIQATLPLASGNALNMLDPEPGGIRGFPDFDLEKIPPLLAERLFEIDAPATEALALYLSGVDPSADELAAFNASLQKAGIAFRLEATARPKRK